MKLATHERRQFLKEISSGRKPVPLVVTKKIIIISLPLEGIIGSTFRKK